jgi:hypothetical protein
MRCNGHVPQELSKASRNDFLSILKGEVCSFAYARIL